MEPTELQRQIAKDIAANMLTNDVAKKHGVSRARVTRACWVCDGPAPSDMRYRRTRARNEKIATEYARGADVDSLARKYGLKPATIHCILSDQRMRPAVKIAM